jgi:nitrite reductase/ring-hydroxylating ferredoxin subunit
MVDWIRTVPVDSIPDRGGRLFTYFDKRLALFRTPKGVFATDNRCPHQGYALVRGDVKDGVLTCAWHNWKFDLADGRCVFGGENVRSYPVRVVGGTVEVDVTEPEPEFVRPQLFHSLLEAMEEVDVGRIARDALRLQRIGTPLADIVREGVRYAAPRAEYGWDHSLAVLNDCLRLASLFEGSLSSLPVIQGLAVASEDQVRRPIRPQPDPVDPVRAFGSLKDGLEALPRLVDDEQVDDAEALFRGLMAAGATGDQLRHALLTSITDHFLGYGHPLIYCQKAFDLLDRVGWQEADTVLAPLVPNISWSTRYDRLPYMRRFLAAWQAAELDLSDLLERQDGGPLDAAGYRRALVEGGPDQAFTAVREALEGGVPVRRLIDETSRAAAVRLGRFDIDLDLDDTNEWGWLDVTHTLTYTGALRWAWSVDPSPEVLRGLFHAAWFVQWTGRLDARDGVRAPSPHRTEDPDDVFRAIVGRDPEGAVALVEGYEGPREPLESALARAAAQDHSVAPIMIAHTVKTAQASIVESRALGEGRQARAPMASTARFLASPKRERFVYQARSRPCPSSRAGARGKRRSPPTTAGTNDRRRPPPPGPGPAACVRGSLEDQHQQQDQQDDPEHTSDPDVHGNLLAERSRIDACPPVEVHKPPSPGSGSMGPERGMEIAHRDGRATRPVPWFTRW